MKKTRKIKNKFILIIMILAITIGYALLSTNISIVGVTKIKNARWNIYLDNIQVNEGSVNPDNAAVIKDDRTTVNYGVTLNVPGDYYEFNVDVVNDGTIDAMIDSVVSKVKINDEDELEINSSSIPKYLNYSVSYSNGSKINKKHELKAGLSETYKVRVEFNRDIDVSDLPVEEQTLQLSLSVNYVQKDSTSVSVPKLEVGSYFSMVPNSTSYTLSLNDSGCDEEQTINPSELSLWRIISQNSDGTYDAISEYASSTNICLKGTRGYANLVGALQSVAQSYNNSNYTNAARIFGYKGQTSTISDTSSFDGSTDGAISEEATPEILSGDEEEYNNGILGDTMYLRDYQLVKDVYENNLTTSRVNDNTKIASYWVGSRSYKYLGNNYYRFYAKNVDVSGNISASKPLRIHISNWSDGEASFAVRPIITIKPNLVISDGVGNINSPYTFA